jgi:glutaredoxin 3
MKKKIEIYTTATCPYCIRAKALLNKKGAAFEEIRVDVNPALRPEMVKRASGRTTVPQIFIGDRHVGGCDDLHDLDYEGQLDPLLSD